MLNNDGIEIVNRLQDYVLLISVMSLKTVTNDKANFVRSNFDVQNELNLTANYSCNSRNHSKMLLPNDKKCFQSFHNKLFEPNDRDRLNDCSKSFDILTFKKNKSNAINLNKNLITLNNSLFINDTLNDSLQWCLESSFQNEQKNMFDNELNSDLYANSFEYKSDGTIEQQQSFKSESSRFNSNQNYELLSRKIDANLAEMDIETFSLTNQFSNLLNEINNKFSSTEEVIDGVDDNRQLDCSIDDSLISEINERANALRYEINGTRLKPVLNSSFTIHSNPTDDDENMHNLNESACIFDKNEPVNLESVGISVDSLDNSCFEQKCAEVVKKCKKQDKSKYTLAFEQMEDSTNETLLNYDRYLTKIKRNEIYLNKLFNDLNRRLYKDQLSVDKLSRSEYSVTGSGVGDEQINQSNQSSQNPSKLTKSLQNDLMHSLRQSFDPTTNDYVPLFNLNNSFNSESSSLISAPKNLIQIFTNNKNSPNSSSSDHLSASLEESNKLSKHQSLLENHNLSNENEDKNRERISTRNTNKLTSNKTIEVQKLESLNQNNSKDKLNSIESSSSNQVAGNLYATFRNATTDTDNLSTINNLKIYHNRKTSPIREEDEHESSLTVKEVKKYTSFQNVTAACRLNSNKIDTSLQMNDNEPIIIRKTDCPRSISMNDFSNETKRPNLIKQYSLKNSSNVTQHNNEQQHSIRPTMIRTNRNSKECSISSGYLSSGGSNNMFENNRKHFQQQQQRLFHHYHQQSTSCEDKQVQTSIYENSLPIQQTPILINELPNSKNFCPANSNAPIYVYYPNYSLPDLNFIFSQNGSFQNIHLSPTKFQPASFECSSCSTVVKRRKSFGTNRANLQSTIKDPQRVSSLKSRPKSTGDFEKLTKESLNTIKDWESLATLLPDDIKELIKTLNLRSDDEDDEFKIRSKTTSNTPTSTKTFQKAIQNSSIKLRSKPIGRLNSNDKNQQTDQFYSNNEGNNKRFSLQEPIYRMDNGTSNCRRGIVKSITMNMPPQYNNMQSKMFHQPQCHHSSCCNLNQPQICQHQMMNMGSCCHCSHGSHCSSNHFSTNQFNQCSSGNYPMMNNFSMSHCQVNPSLINDQQYHNNAYYYQQQAKMTSPMKPCNPISEQNEDNDFESLNFLMENEDEDGELDFDRLLNCKLTKKQVAKKSNKTENVPRKKDVNIKTKNPRLNDCSKEFQKSKENFNDLKNQWERIATSSRPIVQTTPTTPTTKKSITSDQQQLSKTQSTIKSHPVTSRQPRNQTKSKIINRRSRSKSPEKSNKEVIILTKKSSSNKPQITLKPVNSSTLTRTKKQINKPTGSNQQTNIINTTTNTKKPVRPSSFNSQFKSMIPIARTIINKSPPK